MLHKNLRSVQVRRSRQRQEVTTKSSSKCLLCVWHLFFILRNLYSSCFCFHFSVCRMLETSSTHQLPLLFSHREKVRRFFTVHYMSESSLNDLRDLDLRFILHHQQRSKVKGLPLCSDIFHYITWVCKKNVCVDIASHMNLNGPIK